MKHAKLLDLKIKAPKIVLREENKIIWKTAYEKAEKSRLEKFPSMATNAPRLPSVSPSHYVLSNEDSDYLIDQLPKAIVNCERPVVVCHIFDANQPSQLYIHRDVGRASTINFYVKTSKEVTSFYEFDKENMLVELIESFCAKDGEVWAMCSKTPHGVEFFAPTTRIALNFSFKKTTYDNLIKVL